MSFRNNLAVSSALVLVSLCGASSVANAADTKPIVHETCAQATLVQFRTVGHPGKSVRLPMRQVNGGVPCAREERKPMTLASYTDARGGQALVRGQTERALEQIYSRKSGSYSLFELNNQCVAHTVLRQWKQASDACDAAVASAVDRRERERNRNPFDGFRNSGNREVATAYSNRAVMYWLSNDAVAAHNDLVKARKLAPYAAYVKRNLAVAAPESSWARAGEDLAPIG
jgi:hypothetical protein